MLRLNWEKLKKETKGDMKLICKYLSNAFLQDQSLPNSLVKNKWMYALYYLHANDKQNFIIDIDSFLLNYESATDNERYVYLDLLSKRSMFTYLNTKKKVTFLPIWRVVADYDIDKLKTNRLLVIDEHNVYFVYEGD